MRSDCSPEIMESHACDEIEFVNQISKMNGGARFLLDHLSACEATIFCGGFKGAECGMDQTATWRRAFCYEYSKSDSPFGIVSSCGRPLPKCVALCQLSGKHSIFYADSFALARILCLSAQKPCEPITHGVHAVITKAQNVESSILVTFCLPFQAGLDRAHWDIRTIRKTAKGAVKDGELAFATGDAMPRTVPCTRSIEHWTDALVSDVSRKIALESTVVCLDAVGCDCVKTMDPEAMQNMIDMLKKDRKKIMDTHKAELASIHKSHKAEMEKMLARVEEAEQDASIRIAKVANASKTAEEVMRKKEVDLNNHNITLREQVLALEKSNDKLTRDLNAANLKGGKGGQKAGVRQKTLEAQVSSLKGNVAKTTAEWARQRKNVENVEQVRKLYENKINELSKVVSTKETALKAIEVSAKETRDVLAKTRDVVLQRDAESAGLKTTTAVYKGLLHLAAVKLEDARERALADATSLKEETEAHRRKHERMQESMEATIKETREEVEKQELLNCQLKKTVDALNEEAARRDRKKHDGHRDEELESIQKKLEESEREVGRKSHLLKETDKRVKYLERSLKESDEELRSLKATVNASAQMISTGGSKSDKPLQVSCDNKTDAKVEQNTAVYVQSPPVHPQAFPQFHNARFNMDPNLENTISSLHSALNTVVSIARMSSANGRNAEISQAKLEAIASYGILPPHPPAYYETHAAHHFARYS